MTWREYSRITSRPARRTGVPGGPWKQNSIAVQHQLAAAGQDIGGRGGRGGWHAACSLHYHGSFNSRSLNNRRMK
jgi:hypothetical protein